MTKQNPQKVAEILALRVSGMDWSSAPKALREAQEALEAATAEHVTATDQVSDCEMEVPAAAARWDASAKAAIRGGEDLPNRDGTDRARIALQIAVEDEKAATTKATAALWAFTRVLDDKVIRDQWREAIASSLPALRQTLTAAADTTEPVAANLRSAIGMTFYLGGDWLKYEQPLDAGDATDSLRDLARMPEWTPAPEPEPIPAGTARHTYTSVNSINAGTR